MTLWTQAFMASVVSRLAATARLIGPAMSHGGVRIPVLAGHQITDDRTRLELERRSP